MEGARVSLLKAGYSNAIREVASATTLDNGEYRIPRVTAGQYVVKAVVPPTERLPSALGVETGYAATFYPQATDAAQAAPVDVADGGSEIRGIDIHMAQTRLYHSAWETPAANR